MIYDFTTIKRKRREQEAIQTAYKTGGPEFAAQIKAGFEWCDEMRAEAAELFGEENGDDTGF